MLPRIILALVIAACFSLPAAISGVSLQPPVDAHPQLIRRFVLYVGIALGLVWLIELLFATTAATISRQLERWAATAAAHPWITVGVTALVATLMHGIALAGLAGVSWDPRAVAMVFIWSCGLGVAGLLTVGATAPGSIVAISAAFLGNSVLPTNPAPLALPYAPWVLAAWFLLGKAFDVRAAAGAALLLMIASAVVRVASPPQDGLAILVALWSVGALAIALGDGSARVKAYRLAAAAVAALPLVALPVIDGWLQPGTLEAATTVSFRQHTLTTAFLIAALLSPKRLLAHRAILACGLGSAIALAVGQVGLRPEPVASTLLGAPYTVAVSLLVVVGVPALVASTLGVRAVLEAQRSAIVVMTLGIAAAAALAFGAAGGWSSTGRAGGWLTLFALSGAVAVPATFRAAARSFPRVLPIVSATALAVLLLSLGLLG